MSAYNVLTTPAKCPICSNVGPFRIQFKFGDTWQLEYRLGDTLNWGGNDIGKRGLKSVLVEGTAENRCPSCGTEFLEFDLVVQRDKLVDVIPLGRVRADDGNPLTYKIVDS